MFHEYSKKFESGYRAFFTVWVVLWVTFNIGDFLYKLASYSNITENPAEIGKWLFGSVGAFVGLALGILLLFILNSVPEIIAKNKVLTNVGLILVLGVVYFLFPTFVSVVGNSMFDPRNFIKWFPFTLVWLMPSLLILGLHIAYCVNLNKYNDSLPSTSD